MRKIKMETCPAGALILILTLFVAPVALADDSVARGIMQKVDDRDDGDNITNEMEMILFDKRQKKRIRKLYSFKKDKGKDTYGILFFLHPADVKNTGFLTYDYDDPDKDDDQWLYLPALRKTKRIATSDKDGSFMGSDLNYADMTSRDLEDHDFSFYEKGKASQVRGKKVWVIWSMPRSKDVVDETGYPDEARRRYGEEYLPEMAEPLATKHKPFLVKDGEDYGAVIDSVGLCKSGGTFVMAELYWPDIAQALEAATGMEMPVEKLKRIGERIYTLQRCYNVRHGITRADDRLPRRFSEEPSPSGNAEGEVIDLEPMLDEYYALRGWDVATGVPKPETLKELGLGPIDPCD